MAIKGAMQGALHVLPFLAGIVLTTHLHLQKGILAHNLSEGDCSGAQHDNSNSRKHVSFAIVVRFCAGFKPI